VAVIIDTSDDNIDTDDNIVETSDDDTSEAQDTANVTNMFMLYIGAENYLSSP